MLTRRLRMFLSLLLAVLMLALSVPAYAAPTATPEPSLPPLGEMVAEYNESRPEELTVDQLYSQAAILINEDTGEVLLEVNHLKKHYPIEEGLMKRRVGTVKAVDDVSLYINRNETLGRKIRDNQLKKIPYILVVGEKEAENGEVSVRKVGEGDKGSMKIANFAELLTAEVKAMTE